MRRVEIIAHRGASFDAPENTLAALRLGWAQGADAAEFDVLLSRDGQVVVHHDETTRRTAGVDWAVAEQTLDELRSLDVGRSKGPAFAGERIPTLAEALATIPPGKRVFIEVKTGPETIAELGRVITASQLTSDQTVIISFSADVVAAAKRELPERLAYWVADLRPEATDRPVPLEELIAVTRSCRADGLDLSADPAITSEFVRTANAAGLPVYVWTVNDPALARQMIDAGVAGIATDRPGWLRERLRM
ncbi:MAG: glycerophosphodiester phosphodiesterase [Zavarzinella sp.]|nr:glycerophosphodiester phosphodiesterase [Zavarzinella sp.]